MARMQIPSIVPGRVRLSAAVLAALGFLAACASPPRPPEAPTAAPARPSPLPVPAPAPAPAPAAAMSPPAQDPAAMAARFASWLADYRTFARASGVSDATLQSALDGAQYLPRVVELDRAQPEFTRAVWDYLDTAASAERVARGQQQGALARADIDAAAARYGVPAGVLLAIWGMESNFGSNYGSTPTVDALATLGFDGRRGDWARKELLAALQILDRRDIDPAHMVGSWAGAMGQTQFMPSTFLTYAVDADGDGRRDIWGSMADVMASTANFMARSGWRSGQPWGVEVSLPPGFDPARADPSVRQAASQWAAEGVRAADGRPLPELPDAELLLPAGARGPAFLVGPNFRALLRYNNSTSYALGVGLLAQRLAGGPGVQAPWPRDLVPLSRSQVTALQTALNTRGFDTGTPDGVAGPATRRGLRDWQRSVGLPADGYPTTDVLQRLQAP